LTQTPPYGLSFLQRPSPQSSGGNSFGQMIGQVVDAELHSAIVRVMPELVEMVVAAMKAKEEAEKAAAEDRKGDGCRDASQPES
jgi:hypothetical protein